MAMGGKIDEPVRVRWSDATAGLPRRRPTPLTYAPPTARSKGETIGRSERESSACPVVDSTPREGRRFRVGKRP